MNKKSICATVRSKKGSTLLTVVIVFLFLTVIVATGAVIAQANIRRSTKTNEYSSSYYVAEAALNEYSEKLETWLNETTKDYSTSQASLAQDFLTSQNANANGVIPVTFDKQLMGSTANATVTLVQGEQTESGTTYTLTSNGTLGTSSRTVSRSFTFKQEQSKDNSEVLQYDPNAIVTIDFSDLSGNSLENFKFPPSGQSARGPFITNRRIVFDQYSTYSGAILTSNTVTMTAGSNLTGVLILNNRFNFQVTGGNANIHTLVLKDGGSIYIDAGYDSALAKIDYLLLPVGTNFDDVVTYKSNSVNQSIYNKFKSKVVYYHPSIIINGKTETFDPWNLDFYVNKNVNPTQIFGNDPLANKTDVTAIDYRQYFTTDFVLDNMDKPEIVAKYNPNVVLPPMPDITKYTMYPSSSSNLVDGKGNLVSLKKSANESEINVSGTSVFETINIETEWGVPFYFNYGNSDLTIITKSLKLSGDIRFVGTGKVKIHILGNNGIISNTDLRMSVNNGFGVYDSKTASLSTDVSRFMFVFNKTNNGSGNSVTLDIGTWTLPSVYAMFYSDNLNMNITAAFYGAIISPNATQITSAGGGGIFIDTPLIFAPKAQLSIEGALFRGLAVVRDMKYSSYANVEFNSNNNRQNLETILEPIIIVPPAPGSGGSSGSGTGSGTGTGTSNSKTLTWGVTREGGGD